MIVAQFPTSWAPEFNALCHFFASRRQEVTQDWCSQPGLWFLVSDVLCSALIMRFVTVKVFSTELTNDELEVAKV